MPKKLKLQDLIESTIGSSRQGCFAGRLPVLAAEFLSAVMEAKKEGRAVVGSIVAQILVDNWGINIRANTVRTHLRGQCSCKK